MADTNLDSTPAIALNGIEKVDLSESLKTKQEYRKKVWENLERNKLAKFPRPVYGRIPNFLGSEEAAKQLQELDIFKVSQNIEVNPDKPQEAARIIVLENKKNLYVPVPRLKNGLLKQIIVPEDANKSDIKQLVNRKGIEDNGKDIGLEDKVKIDLFVLGSVAVSKEGYRIGKGRGFADLEYAVLLEKGAIHKDTVIVTIVHDNQVFETIPKEIFQSYDVPVDYIITPTQVIKVTEPLPRPTGIFWNLISNRRVGLMPILQSLKDTHISQGKVVTLKEEDTDVESYEPKSFFKYRRFVRRRRSRPRTESKGSESRNDETGAGDAATNQKYRGKRFFRRREPLHEIENGDASHLNNRPRRGFRKNKPKIDFSLEVRNIEKSVRVRDLKNALNEHGIKPNEITWRGYKGFCFLHYAKPASKTNPEEQSPVLVDNVIEILKNMKIKPESETSLCVKIMEPISRIVTTDVTAV